MRSTAIVSTPAAAPAAETAPRGRTGAGFARVLALCTDVDTSTGSNARASDDAVRAESSPAPRLAVVSNDDAPTPEAIDAAADDDEVEVLADDEIELVADDDAPTSEDETIEAIAVPRDAEIVQPTVQVADVPPAAVVTIVAPASPTDAELAVDATPKAPIDDARAIASPRVDSETTSGAEPTTTTTPLRAFAVRRPTPADGTDARARASIATRESIVTGVPMRTDGGVRVDLRAPVVGPTRVPFGGVAAVASDETTTPRESVASTIVAPELLAREPLVQHAAAPEAVARETASIETTPRAPAAIEPRVAKRSAGERRGPITLARTEAMPSVASDPTSSRSGASSSEPPPAEPSRTAVSREDANASAPSDPAPTATRAPVERERQPEAPVLPDASPDARVGATSEAAVATPTIAEPLASAPPVPAESPTAARAPAPATPDAPVVITRAEDLAHAIEKLKPIPRGGATLDVETPGMGQLRLHVRVEEGVVKVRIHASSDAASTWLAQERDGLTAAARGAVNGALGIELDLRGGTNDASDRRPAREPNPTPLPYAAAPSRAASTSAASSSPAPTARARGLVDVLA